MIGHNPALHDLARWLDKAAPHSLPTGSVLHFTLSGSSWKSAGHNGAKLAGFLTPETASYPLFQRLAPQPPKRNNDTASRMRDMMEHQYQMARALKPVSSQALILSSCTSTGLICVVAGQWVNPCAPLPECLA